jgi:hypothetical protein
MNTYKKLEKNKPVGNLYLEVNLIEAVADFTEDMTKAELTALGYCRFDNNTNDPNKNPDPNINYYTWNISGAEEMVDADGDKTGIWENTWKKVSNADAEAAITRNKFKLLRESRDSLLVATDWAALSDTSEMSNKVKIYRQALRDMTKDLSDPDDAVWPEPINPDTSLGRK